MSFDTTPMTVKEAKAFIAKGGAVVSASRKEYFGNTKWVMAIREAQIKDEGREIILSLASGDFIEFSSEAE